MEDSILQIMNIFADLLPFLVVFRITFDYLRIFLFGRD